MKKRHLLITIGIFLASATGLFAQTHYGPEIFETYTEDFNDGVADGFVAVSSSEEDWSITANSNLIDPTVSYADSSHQFYNSNGDDMVWSVLDDKTFENYTVDVVIYPVWGNKTGILFNYQDENNFYCLEYWSSSNGQRMYLRQKINGTWEDGAGADSEGGYVWDADDLFAESYPGKVDNTTAPEVSNWFEGGEFDIKLTLKNADGLTSVWLNDTPTEIMDASTADLTSGKIGFFTHWCPAFFDDLAISSNVTAGISIKSEASVNVYPNPVRGSSFKVEAPQLGSNASLQIFDISGKVVYSDRNIDENAAEINIDSNFNPGIYILKLQSDNIKYTSKIAVQ